MTVASTWTKSCSLRLALGVGILTWAVALLQPGPPPPSGATWETLVRPLGAGRPVTIGYVLGPPHRGEEHDVVFTARAFYVPPVDAFMAPFAEIAASRPERRMLTVAHYDGTLLSYYLARNAGVPMDWNHLQPEGGSDGFLVGGTDKVIEALAQSHALAEDPDAAALAKLEGRLAVEAVLVVERDGFHLPRLSDRLRRCERLAEIGTGRLYRCAGPPTER